MSKRRGYGEGSIYQRKDGLWIGSINAGFTERGTRRRVTVSATSRPEARRKLLRKRAEIERDGVTPGKRATVAAWIKDWLPIAERNLGPSSYNATASAMRKWVVPQIGHRRFDLLTPADIRKVLDAQREAGLTLSTQRRTHSAMMSLLKAARAEGYPVPTRVLEVPAPAKGLHDRLPVSVQQATALFTASERTADRTARWMAALLQGLRQAEALGLRWSDVDLDRDVIFVDWQLKALRYRKARDRSSGFRVPDGYEAIPLRHAYHLVRPKTGQSRRVVPIVPWFRTALERWREVAPASPHDLVFPDDDGEPMSSKSDDAAWYALQDVAEVRHPSGRHFTIHEARHATATLLTEAGVDAVVISAILGHTSTATTRGYQHAQVELVRRELNRAVGGLQLAELFGPTGAQ